MPRKNYQLIDEEQRQKLLGLKKELQVDHQRRATKSQSPTKGSDLQAKQRGARDSHTPTPEPKPIRPVKTKTQSSKKSKAGEPPIVVTKLAQDLGIPFADVEREIAARRKPGAAYGPLRAIYPSYAENLRSFFDERRQWREKNPIVYRADPSGRITFETYERIPLQERETLTAQGFLPSRSKLIKNPDQVWPEVQRHAEGRRPPVLTDSSNHASEPAAFSPFPTPTSIGSSLVPKMKAVLDPMSPMSYAKFFSLMRALLALDAKIGREIGNQTGYLATNRQHADIIDAVCKYGFGMFAYEHAGKRLSKRASSKPNPTREKAIESLMRLRPMYQGLLTDMFNQRFVTWRVGEVWDFVEFRFEDMRDWLHGLETGNYVPLTTHITRVSGSSRLPSRDAALIKYMIQAADNLREGNTQRASTPISATRTGNSRESASSSGSPGVKARSLGYRAAQTWLVPICVVDGTVETSLDRDFFTGGPLSPHQVRSFYRRPKGSGLNALKTEFVSGHTRGGKGMFHNPDLLPSVTVLKK